MLPGYAYYGRWLSNFRVGRDTAGAYYRRRHQVNSDNIILFELRQIVFEYAVNDLVDRPWRVANLDPLISFWAEQGYWGR